MRPTLKRGVTVALQILVLSVKVRILALQPIAAVMRLCFFFLRSSRFFGTQPHSSLGPLFVTAGEAVFLLATF